jgi:hypothetical protein
MCSDIARRAPKDTAEFLIALDPPFETELELEDPQELNNHRIMMIFAKYFAANRASFSAKQLRRLGDWLNSAVAAGGELENAVSTCFLEHVRQLKVNRMLAPYLSQAAKDRTHA